MKEVKAYVKTLKHAAVIERLHKIEGLTGVTILPMKAGFGRERSEDGPLHIVDNTEYFVPHCKFEIICRDDLVEKVITAIQEGAHTGLREDGKIYISPIEDAVRISTNERGEDAV
jgi:nitrogen regulatory protein P-II 1